MGIPWTAYGFVGTVFTNLFLVLYLCWTLMSPDYVGIFFPALPNRYWALVPPTILLAFIFVYGSIYCTLGVIVSPIGTEPLHFLDSHSRQLTVSDFGSSFGFEAGSTKRMQSKHSPRSAIGMAPSSTPQFGDIPPALVARLQAVAAKQAGS